MDCIQRKIVVRPCPTTISFCPEGFFDDHFAVTLKPLCGERGIRTPGTLRYNGFRDRHIRPLCHLSCDRSREEETRSILLRSLQRYAFFSVCRNELEELCGCDPGGTQTLDLQNRNLTLYSTKLLSHLFSQRHHQEGSEFCSLSGIASAKIQIL